MLTEINAHNIFTKIHKFDKDRSNRLENFINIHAGHTRLVGDRGCVGQ